MGKLHKLGEDDLHSFCRLKCIPVTEERMALWRHVFSASRAYLRVSSASVHGQENTGQHHRVLGCHQAVLHWCGPPRQVNSSQGRFTIVSSIPPPNSYEFFPPKVSKVQLSSVGPDKEEIVFAKSNDTPSTSSLSTTESNLLLVDLLLRPTLCNIQLSKLGQLTEEDLGCLCRFRRALVPPWPLVSRYVLLRCLVEAFCSWWIWRRGYFERSEGGSYTTTFWEEWKH